MEEKKKIYLKFIKELKNFTETVSKLVRDRKDLLKGDFLKGMAEEVDVLYLSSVQVLKCEDTAVKAVGSIVQEILDQPLSENRVTILKAAREFPLQEDSASTLSYIIGEYIKYPETTKSFIRELELLSEDMHGVLQAI